MKNAGVGYIERSVKVYLGESISDFLTVEMYIKSRVLEKKSDEAIFSRYCAVLLTLF